MRQILPLLSVLILTASTQSAFGYYATLDNGELMNAGHYRLGVSTQFITEGDDGINIAGRFDGPIDDELNWRALLGFGTTDVYVGAFFKWVPIPDTESQPAVGFLTGVLYARYENNNELSLRIHPFISKKFEVTFGLWTPYAALPFGIRSYDGNTQMPLQADLGSEFRFDGLENVAFWAEIGLDISKAFPYFSIGATLAVDDENGIQIRRTE